MDIGNLGSDSFGYIATVEPFHGNTVAVYKKNAENSFTSIKWQRQVLDVFGVQNNQSFEGTGHHVITADFDGNGNDEFLVALRGPYPFQGNK